MDCSGERKVHGDGLSAAGSGGEGRSGRFRRREWALRKNNLEEDDDKDDGKRTKSNRVFWHVHGEQSSSGGAWNGRWKLTLCYPLSMPRAAKSTASVSSRGFDEAYARLNADQKRAVDSVEGPVMCIAGPGTGKTEVVALRVANILKKTHARPSNILCLTFSVSAATSMRERLRSLIGPDAYGVTVRNFHGFCADLIAGNPIVFDSWSALEPISDIERYREVNKIIDQLMPNCVLVSRKSPYTRTRDLIQRISELKREGVTDRTHLLELADRYEQELAGESKEGTKTHERNLLTARKFKEFLELFFRYQEMLQRTQRYDYEDMILFASKALELEDWLLAGLQERYQYVLVDEFQDTNGAQYHLVELLTTPRTPEDKPNLFTVGDDDQAIYRFQGANLANILKFRTRFPAAPIVPLTVSYRCTQPILDAAESLITHNTERLVGQVDGLSKHLTSGAAEKSGPSPTLLLAQSDAVEPWLIADIVEERIKKNIPPQEIAILCQTNAEVMMMNQILTARSIPVEVTGKADLLGNPLVLQAIAIMKAVLNPKVDSALSQALSCECFGLHPADIGRLQLAAREGKVSLYCILFELDQAGLDKDPQNQESILRIAIERWLISGLKSKTKLIDVRDILLDLHNKLQLRTVVDTLEKLLKQSKLINPDIGLNKGSNDIEILHYAALQEFFDRIKRRAYEQPGLTAETFIDELGFYENADYSDIRMGFSLPHLSEAGVQLMTVHQSKGMEFTVVILPNFREGHWDKKRNPSSLSLPEELLFGWHKDQKTYERAQDERRIAYVAFTRAKRELIFTCPKELTTGDKLRSVSPSGFFAEAGALPEQEQALKNPKEALLLLAHPVRDMDEEMRAFLRERLRDYALSVTALNHFLEDPLLFLQMDLLQMPQAKTSSLIYGNAVHDALRKWGLSVQQGTPLDSSGFVGAFRSYLEAREILTEKERARLQHLGEEALPRYFTVRLAGTRSLIHKVEFGIQTHLGDIPLKGKIDRIDFLAPESSDAVIIDYKTGHPLTEKQIREDGDYYRQLVFYALLLGEKNALITPREYILDFIGEGTEHPVQRSFIIAQSEIDELKKVVEAVWAKILALDFTPLAFA